MPLVLKRLGYFQFLFIPNFKTRIMAYDFNREEEVKEFIKNLGIEYRFGCFHEKKPQACHLLGDYLEAIMKNFEKALLVYRNNCDVYQHAHSCHKTGAYYLQGKGMAKLDDFKAIEYFEKGCKLGYWNSCYRGGSVVMNSPARVRDYTQGLALYEKGCNNGIADSCMDTGLHYLNGSAELNMPKNLTRAEEYFRKGCDLDHMGACVNLSIMYKIGHGVEKNLELSEKYKKKALDLEADINRNSLQFQVGLSPT